VTTVGLIPAIALVAGAAIGSLAAHAPSLSPWAASFGLAAWGAAGVGLRSVPAVLVAALVTVGFLACGVGLGQRAARDAWAPLNLMEWHARAQASAREETSPVVLVGRIREDAALTPQGASFTVDAIAIGRGGSMERARGGVRVYVSGTMASAACARWRAGRRVSMPVALRRPLPYRNFETTDQELALARRGTRLLASVKSASLVTVVSRGYWWEEAAAAVRAYVRLALAASVGRFGGTTSAVVAAVVIGDRAGLSVEVEDRLQRAGTYHVIAISGGNIALIALVLLWLPRRLRAPPRAAVVIAIVGLAAYAAIAEGGASVARATLVALTYFAARWWDHRTAPVQALAVAAAAHAAVSPLVVFDAGFALSFGATLGILRFAQPVADLILKLAGRNARQGGEWREASAWARATGFLLAASVAAECALFPVSAFAFGRVTFAGLLLNFAAVPLMSVVQIAGLAAATAWTVSPELAQIPGLVAHLAAAGILESARLVDLAPWAVANVPPPSALVVATYYVGLLALACVPPSHLALGSRSLSVRACALASIVSSAAWIMAPHGNASLPDPLTWIEPSQQPSMADARGSRWLVVTFLDVGQGDSTLVQMPDGRTLLVDTGGLGFDAAFDVGARVVAPALWALGLRHLSRLEITHGDPDHSAGALAVAERFAPAEVWEGIPVAGHHVLDALRSWTTRERGRWRQRRRGEKTTIDRVRIDVWHPPDPEWERRRVRNDDSLVVDIRYGGVSIVLPGDISTQVERELAGRFQPARLRVLKAAHHGSRTSTGAEFLLALRPALVVFSCGRDNRYGHPAPDVLRRVRGSRAAIARTDEDGAVQVATDGRAIVGRTASGRTFVIDSARVP
jgi:competence protein ComEC